MSKTIDTSHLRTITPDDPTDVHTYFGLSYANYLVLHRTLMQSMPMEWQHRMTACLEELDDAFRTIERPQSFKVTAAIEREVGELTDAELAAASCTRAEELDEDDGDDHTERYFYDEQGRELQSWMRVLLPCEDPVPHYERGRTRVTRSDEWSGAS